MEKIDTYKTVYKEMLDNFSKFLKSGNGRICTELLDSYVTDAISTLGNEVNDQKELKSDDLIRTLSKDLNRYWDSFNYYQNALEEMGTSDKLITLRKKLVKSPIFFDEIWKEKSDKFFRSKKLISKYFKDPKTIQKLTSALDCIAIGLRRYLYGRYSK